MALELGMITVDCADPRGLAAFWTAALGVRVAADYGAFVMLERPASGGPTMGFQQVPEPRPGKNRVHTDFVASDREAEVRRLVGLGATELDRQTQPGLAWTVLSDPEGNEFCVAERDVG
ncbi:VOC family protein [Amycolatopsis jiangsuensis]|uniref:Putative enzyme related to lactoylglutathione lyase n=1 Tax=Amycolatopsis jiangsuensis TaxID=1181879 RepID=A0A840IRM1_9PSEU|nr:VOC family protein [Amycolatopsis jiangsuensis]MBB4685231.1 putative enzyme related to lactoylglutathione lyase [Amycolatopsis jiangsuensis]